LIHYGYYSTADKGKQMTGELRVVDDGQSIKMMVLYRKKSMKTNDDHERG